MDLPKHARNHPLRFLVYVDWIVLLVVALGQRPHLLVLSLPLLPWLNGLGLSILALTSLWIPTRMGHRILYLGTLLGLILAMALIGGIRLFPLLFLIPVIRSWFMFRLRGCLILTGMVLLLCMLAQLYRFRFLNLLPMLSEPSRVRQIWLGSMFLAGLTLVFLQWLIAAVQSERRSREQLMAAHTQLRHYALEIEELAIVQERNRIARDIHDSLGHSLTVFNLHLEAALRLLQADPEEARALLVEAKQLGSTALQEVRQSVTALRSDPLQGRSLNTAITALMDDFQRSTGITPQFHYRVDVPLAPKLEIAIYRITQEALTNICKYAEASQVAVAIQADQQVRLRIQDNGQGFDATQTTTGFGLQGMQERTLALAGNFTLTTAPQAGCCIEAVFPRIPAFQPNPLKGSL